MNKNMVRALWSEYRIPLSIVLGVFVLTGIGTTLSMRSTPHQATTPLISRDSQTSHELVAYAIPKHHHLPVGQLPEVPWASVIPLILLTGFGLKSWRRDKAQVAETSDGTLIGTVD